MRGKLVVLAALVLVASAGVGVATAGGEKPATKMTDDLAALHHHALAAGAARMPLEIADPLVSIADDLVTIDTTAADDPNVLAADLYALGAVDVAVAGLRVSARLPIAALPLLETLSSLRFAWPAYAATNVGAVTSQGDVAMRANIARNRFGLDGAGVMVGVLSDSFGCLPGGVANGTSRGDLPPTVMVIQDLLAAGCTDEGRGMLEIVHDVAPGAPLAFATAFLGQASFANNIRVLRAFGAKVIVDDVSYVTEPMFQDGVIAKAVNDVVAAGTAYFSSAGNAARMAYESAFVPGTVYNAADPRLGSNPVFLGGTAHDFGGTPFQAFNVRGGASVTLSLQWDSPFASVSGVGTPNDVDVYVLNSTGTQILLAATTNNISAGDPVEALRISCGGPANCPLTLLIVRHTGPNPGRFKYVLFQAVGNVTTTPALNGGTIFGHANAQGAVAVGAAYYQQTPAFGVAKPVLEFFSSSGTTPILFGPTGARLPTPDLRASKPEISAPDGANTSFFGGDAEGDGFPNFFGTSAAAPHAAGVGALMLQAVPTLTPAQMRTALQTTAIDMAAPGFDNDSGAGLIQADAALLAAGAKDATTTALSSSVNPAVAGQPVTFTARVSVPIPGALTPTGMVSFFDSGVSLGTAVLDVVGSASFTTSALTAGMHAITTQYGGDAHSGPSTGALSQTINKANTTTVVVSSASFAVFGQPVTFTATVSGVAPSTRIPTGSVTFLRGPTALGTVSLNPTGQATFTTSALTVGTTPIVAVYGGDASANSSGSSSLAQTIVTAVSSTAVMVSAPPIFGAVTLTATVTLAAPSVAIPTGAVTFIVDGAPLVPVPLNATGQATLMTTTIPAGPRTIVASYPGDANVLQSVSSVLPVFVTKAPTTTTLTSSVNPSVTGQPLILTAMVGLVAPSVGIPTGVVTFRDGPTVLGAAPLLPIGGVATASLPTALAAGTHGLTASFEGDANTIPSTSAPRPQTVARAATSLTLTTSAGTAVLGQPVTFTAALGVLPPAAGSPTGSVAFFDGATALGTAPANAAGVATLTTTAMTLGPHSITARYGGDASFTDSASSSLTVTILRAATATSVTTSASPVPWHQPVTLTAAVVVLPPGTGTPTRMVTFFDGPTSLGTAMLNATGLAALTLNTLTLGDHPITASYGGAPGFDGSVSPALTQTITRAPSATTLISAPSPALSQRPVVLTATVVVVPPSTGVPTGSVTFFDGPTPLGTVPVTAGRARLTTSALAVGARALTAGYSGDARIAPSTSSAVTETINRAPTTTAVTSSAGVSVTGRAVTFTAKVSVVAPGTGTPTGSVTFRDGATPLATVPVDATRVATLTISTLLVGAHPITAVYEGDASFAPSMSPVLTETVGKAATKTIVTTSATPVVHGIPVTFTATVTVVAPGAGTPTGTVTFLNGVTVLGTASLDGTGQASLTTDALVAGARPITARYGGDARFTTSTSAALAETVTKASTTTSLASSVPTSVAGQPVVLTATVAVNAPGAGTPTGSVMFLNGAAVLGTATLSAAGQAVLTTSTLTVGPHTITARYAGDASFIASAASALTVTVAKASTVTAVTSSTNPAALRQPVTFTATVSVSAPGGGTPTGTVTFFNGPTSLGTRTLALGRATLVTSALGLGDHDVTVSYAGAASFNGSVSPVLDQTVTRAASSTALTSSRNPALTGQAVVLTATVAVVAPGAGTPTGTVTFLDGAVTLGTVTLNAARQAVLTTNALAVDMHAITASYAGDTNVAPSTSSVVMQTINQGGTSTTLTASPNPAKLTQSVTLTATVNVLAPAVGTPTGAVIFWDGTTVLGVAPLNALRKATLTTSALAVGAHPLRAMYGGDPSFAASTSALLTEKVTP